MIQKVRNPFPERGVATRDAIYIDYWARVNNRFEDFKGLYIVGAGTHPGGGIPGVLSTAKLTTNLISRLEK